MKFSADFLTALRMRQGCSVVPKWPLATPRSGAPWTERDDLLLRLMIEMGHPEHEIAEALERTENAIRSYRYHKGYKYKLEK